MKYRKFYQELFEFCEEFFYDLIQTPLVPLHDWKYDINGDETKVLKRFRVNDYIEVKLVQRKKPEVFIYVNQERFMHCAHSILVTQFGNNLMEYVNERLNMNLETEKLDNSIPDLEFFGYCSNLQYWSENNYNTNLIPGNYAFSILKKLVEAGDLNAGLVFKNEIIKRIEKGNKNVIGFLFVDGYLNYLDENDWIVLIIYLFI